MKRSAGPIAVAVLGVALVGSSAHAYSSYGYRSRRGGDLSGALAFGVNLAKLTDDAEDMGVDDSKMGFCGGVLVEAPMSYDVSVLTGFFFTQKGGEGSADATPYGFPGVVAEVEMELDFVEFPVLLKVSGGRGQPYVV
ncbi:MAG: porin family protein, partial [Planctomycetota bacterium]